MKNRENTSMIVAFVVDRMKLSASALSVLCRKFCRQYLAIAEAALSSCAWKRFCQ
jgi:hypothetical protein